MPTAKPATHRLSAREGEVIKAFAFAASKRTAKSEKLTHVGSEGFSDLFSENLQRFKPRSARIWNLGKPSPLGRGDREAVGEVLAAKICHGSSRA